ncbi:MAG TPA: hypothetical protein PKC43_02320 [Phycisphaerales bacterium]|nr:hypothetical protein [Phycisphaerales bacterium]HMP36260.1 hypothetical protein [Phycisphaerales bacterium]
MTDLRRERPAGAAGARFRRLRAGLGLVLAALVGAAFGCAAPRPAAAAKVYYAYDFPAAREILRGPAAVNSDNVLLDNVRLGMAAMADGNDNEAERAFVRAFDLLSTAGLNADRTTAAVLFYEGVRIWKGEPFEQALAYYWTAAHYATRGAWDNARAAAANSIFRLTDFGRDMSPRELVERAAEDDRYLEEGYTAVETDFALGYLMQAVASDLSGASGAGELFDAAQRLAPKLAPVIAVLRARAYDTLLLIDYGRGPRKVALGPDQAIVEFFPVDRTFGPLQLHVNGRPSGTFAPACDVNRMARDHRWNNLEDVRRAKSLMGTGLLVGGLATAVIGADHGSGAAVGVGLGLIALGALMKASAQGDTRYNDFAPEQIFVVPLALGTPSTISMHVGSGIPGHTVPATLVLPDYVPGTPGRPRTTYLRLFGTGSPVPPWLAATGLRYTNDQVPPPPGGLPWVLGGDDVGTPSAGLLERYRANQAMAGWSLQDLIRLYADLGIVIGAGMQPREGRSRDDSYRHILERGSGLFTPQPWSIGYKRIMYSPAAPFVRRLP